MRGSVTNNNGFLLDDGIYWHFFTITCNYTTSESMTKTLFIPYWTASVSSSTVTNAERRIPAHRLIEL
jgi:hypothetical protein